MISSYLFLIETDRSSTMVQHNDYCKVIALLPVYYRNTYQLQHIYQMFYIFRYTLILVWLITCLPMYTYQPSVFPYFMHVYQMSNLLTCIPMSVILTRCRYFFIFYFNINNVKYMYFNVLFIFFRIKSCIAYYTFIFIILTSCRYSYFLILCAHKQCCMPIYECPTSFLSHQFLFYVHCCNTYDNFTILHTQVQCYIHANQMSYLFPYKTILFIICNGILSDVDTSFNFIILKQNIIIYYKSISIHFILLSLHNCNRMLASIPIHTCKTNRITQTIQHKYTL